jgi:exodeoxyribonuclease III
MLIATWNINSIRMRLDRLLQWLERRKPDVVCLQETKVVDEDFPIGPLGALGYQCIIHGQKSYNGVAILTRQGGADPITTLPGDASDMQCRFLACTVGQIRIINIYAPNGSEVGSEKYVYKLEWYKRLHRYLDTTLRPEDQVLICGDFNIAPEDRDVWDVAKWEGQILFSDPEKKAFQDLLKWGLVDALRMHHPEAGLYTWWDYRAGAFHRGWGLRIDHILVSAPLAALIANVEIDRNERKGEKPSDHAPVLAAL